MTSISHQLIEQGAVKYIDIGNDVLQLKNNEENEYNLNVQDGTPTIFVQQGQYVIPVGGHAVILQDEQGDFEQYIINNVVTDEDMQENDEIQEVIGQPVIYYSGEFTDQSEIFEDGSESCENTNMINGDAEDESNAIIKHFKLESNYVQNYVEEQETNDGSNVENNFLQVQDATGSEKIIIATDHQPPQYQYAILKNGKLHLQTLDVVDAVHCNVENNQQNQQLQERLEAFQQSITLDEAPTNASVIDLDKITGRNLITGQTVTLDSYFDKLQKRLATVDVTNQCLTYNIKKRRRNNSIEDSNSNPSKKVNKGNTGNDSFINKKIVVGKTSNGKRIVGRIVRVDVKGKKDEDNCEKDEAENQAAQVSQMEQEDQVTNVTDLCASNESSTTEVNENLELSADEHTDNDEQCTNNKLTLLNWHDENAQQQSLQPQIIIKKHLVTRENFDYNVGKTLSGLMDLETVQRSLQNKNLVVKLVEKLYDRSTDEFNRTVSYVYGHMELVEGDAGDPDNQQWTFVLHNDTSNIPKESDNNKETVDEDELREQVLANSDKKIGKPSSESASINPVSDNEEIQEDSNTDETKDLSLEVEEPWAPYDETVSLTITITVDRNGKKSTRVNLSPQQSGSNCHICNKEFKTSMQMRKHLNNVHLSEKLIKCDICDKNFANYTILQRHRKQHANDGRWYQCPKCSKSFNTAGSLKRHLTVHDPSLRPLECSVCSQRFTDESSLRKHLLIHTGIRAFACDICNRAFVNQGDLNFHRRIHAPLKQYRCEVCGQEFSRHSNLVRHAEIHRGTGALHRCDICGCSYSFVSSLTRHIVQKHINQQPVPESSSST